MDIGKIRVSYLVEAHPGIIYYENPENQPLIWIYWPSPTFLFCYGFWPFFSWKLFDQEKRCNFVTGPNLGLIFPKFLLYGVYLQLCHIKFLHQVRWYVLSMSELIWARRKTKFHGKKVAWDSIKFEIWPYLQICLSTDRLRRGNNFG